MVLYVAILYVVVQLVEGYLLTPLIQQETVALPPALTIASLVLFGALFERTGEVRFADYTERKAGRNLLDHPVEGQR